MAQAVSPRQFSLLDLDTLRPESPADPPWADPAGGFLCAGAEDPLPGRHRCRLGRPVGCDPKGLLGAVASVRGPGGDAGVLWQPAAPVDVAEYLTALVGEPVLPRCGRRGPFCPPGYVRRSEDRLCEPQSPHLDHRREHSVRGPGRARPQHPRPGWPSGRPVNLRGPKSHPVTTDSPEFSPVGAASGPFSPASP